MRLPQSPLFWVGVGLAGVWAMTSIFQPKPRNREDVERVYGKFAYKEGAGGRIVIDPAWEKANIVERYLFDGKRVRLHRLIADEFVMLYRLAVEQSGYHPKSVQTFVPRHILWNPDKELSYHSWGIAVDFDPPLNSYGAKVGSTALDKAPAFVKVWKDAGWGWGGDWKPKSRDPMHFEAKA